MTTANILIFGSAHVDILAEYDVETKDDINKTGSLQIGIGGVGYNITINLGINGHKSSLYSVLKSNSLSAKLIRESFELRRISTKHLFYDNLTTESGYVAQSLLGKLETGVTSTIVDLVTFIEPNLERAISSSDIVVIDCNLNKYQIASQIVPLSQKHKKPTFISSVSESKVKNALIPKTDESFCFIVFFINGQEANQSGFPNWRESNDYAAVLEICNFYNAENVIISNGILGFSVFSNDGKRRNYPAVRIPKVISELGAGDALAAAVIAYYAKHGNFNWDDCCGLIYQYIKPVLSSRFSVPEINNLDALLETTSSKPHPIFPYSQSTSRFDVFMLMPFSNPFKEIYSKHIKPILLSLDLSSGTAGDIFNNQTIIGDIWEGIKNAQIIIADFTNKNPNVFYEVGLAHSIGKETILITQDLKDIPFDLRHIRIIEYSNTPNGLEILKNNLENVVKEIVSRNSN
jgi:fructose-1-phosphate kinase PfkB-like protein